MTDLEVIQHLANILSVGSRWNVEVKDTLLSEIDPSTIEVTVNDTFTVDGITHLLIKYKYLGPNIEQEGDYALSFRFCTNDRRLIELRNDGVFFRSFGYDITLTFMSRDET